MADKYMVGTSQKKDRYMVGMNQSKENASAYRVGGGGSAVSQANNKQLGSGDQDPVVGGKSAFNYSDDNPKTYKDVGDRGDNSNFGGGDVMGIKKDGATAAGGEIPLTFSEKGDWSTKKDAMARRKAMADNAKDYSGDKLDVPSGFIWKDKVP